MTAPEGEGWLEDDRPDPTVVLLVFDDGQKEFVDDVHIHGVRGGDLLLATGVPGAGLSAEVVRRVPLNGLRMAETISRGPDDEPDGGPDFWMGSGLGHGPVVVSVRAPDGAYWLAGALDEIEVPDSDVTGPAVVPYDGGALISTYDLDDDDRVQLVVLSGQHSDVRLVENFRAGWPAYSHATVRAHSALYIVDVESGPLAQVTQGPGDYEVHLIARAKEPDGYWRKRPDDPLEDHTLVIWPTGAEDRFDE